MKTIAETYRDRLQLLIQRSGSQIAFAEKINRSASQVSQWINASPDSKTGTPRSLTEKSARYVERCFGLPRAWMDQPLNHSTADPLPKLKALTTFGQPLIDHLVLTPEGIKTLLLGQELQHMKLIMPPDDSMVPTLSTQSLVLLDTSINHFRDGGVYLGIFQSQPFLKRMHIGKNKVLNITSDNVAYQASDFVIAEGEQDQLRIIGKAWRTLPLEFTSL
ncbi:MAG: S24 family peptidase [Neisseriaceae bacterium]|nr:S24 family peptidase [Neisseriaceae bacterium]